MLSSPRKPYVICIPKHHAVHLKYIQFLFFKEVNYDVDKKSSHLHKIIGPDKNIFSGLKIRVYKLKLVYCTIFLNESKS